MLARGLKILAFYAIFMSVAIGSAQANTNTNAEFLELSPEYREAFYFGAYSTLGHMLYIQDKEYGQCVIDWFMQQPVERMQELEAVMRQRPDGPPSAVIIGLPKAACEQSAKKQ